MTDTKKNSALADPVPAKMTELVELLRQIRPQYGAVGSRDVDVAEQQRKIDAAIAAIESRALSSVPDYAALEREHLGDPDKGTGIYDFNFAAPVAAKEPQEQSESAYQRGYLDGMAKGRRDAQEQPVAAQQPKAYILHAADGDRLVWSVGQGEKATPLAVATVPTVAAQQQDEMREKLLEYLSMILDAKEAMLSAGIPQNDFQTMFAEFAAKAAPQQEAGQARELLGYDYDKTFDAIGKAVQVDKSGGLHISPKKFWEAHGLAQSAQAVPTVIDSMIDAAEDEAKGQGIDIGDLDMSACIRAALASAPAQPTVPEGMSELLEEIADFPELNERNYSHEDVAEINNWGVVVYQRAEAIREAIAAAAPVAQKGEKG